MTDSVVKVVDGASGFLGTAFAIEKDVAGTYLVTCGHVVNKCKGDLLVEGQKASLVANGIEHGLDLAILFVEDLDLPVLPLAINEKFHLVEVVGYSILSGVHKKESIHRIRSKTGVTFDESQRVKAMRLYPEESISSGYSGSPVICEESNRVVGVVNIQVGDDTNYAICSEHILQLHEIGNVSQGGYQAYVCRNDDLVERIGLARYREIASLLESRVENSMSTYATQKNTWIEPRLHTVPESRSRAGSEDTRVSVGELIREPRSVVIEAKQQFGLTALAHHVVRAAWNADRPSFWLYLDANELKPHAQEIVKHVQRSLDELGLALTDIECVVLDEYSSNIREANRLVQKLDEVFKETPLVIMHSVIENPLLEEACDKPEGRDFESLYLWALPRQGIRELVVKCNNQHYIGSEDAIVEKIVSDMEALNIPRTPFNCLTILKIYEADFDENPVNRTEMIHRVLYLLFSVDDIPQYKTKPDLKDTEYVLGFLCEMMIRKKVYHFTRNDFIDSLSSYCRRKQIDLEVHVIFDVLVANNILVFRGDQFYFKFSYYILYFAAHRMHHSQGFAQYILSGLNYTKFPELIEFYTGIDRRRNDAIETIRDDISSVLNEVRAKCQLPTEMNIYSALKWTPSEKSLEDMRQEVAKGVIRSNMPDTVKDQYADAGYDPTRPHQQSIHEIMDEYSLLRLMRCLSAGSRALRNSDYADTGTRHELLGQLLEGFEELTKVLVALAPVMADQGKVSLQGASFFLTEEVKSVDEAKRAIYVVQLLPWNVVDWYMDDIYSAKMGPLFYKHLENLDADLASYLMHILIARKRPNGWEKQIEKMIVGEHKNSFYLSDMYQTLKSEYQYSFSTSATLDKMERLIKMSAAKHRLGAKKPNKKLLDRVPDSVLPERVESDD